MYAGLGLFDSKTTSSIIAPISTKQVTDSGFSQTGWIPPMVMTEREEDKNKNLRSGK
jgi:hypothetical protein